MAKDYTQEDIDSALDKFKELLKWMKAMQCLGLSPQETLYETLQLSRILPDNTECVSKEKDYSSPIFLVIVEYLDTAEGRAASEGIMSEFPIQSSNYLEKGVLDFHGVARTEEEALMLMGHQGIIFYGEFKADIEDIHLEIA